MVKDLVCGMDVDEMEETKVKHKGKTYYFCGPTCQQEFESNLHALNVVRGATQQKQFIRFKHRGKIYCFCSKEHKNKYQLEHFGQVIY